MKTLLFIALTGILPLFSNVEITSSLQSHYQRTEQVAVDSGKWGIEVLAEQKDADLTCSYSHLDKVILTQVHTNHCFATTDLVLPAYFSVNIINNGSKTINYKVRAFSFTH